MRTIEDKMRISYAYQEGIGLSFAAAAPKKPLSLLGYRLDMNTSSFDLLFAPFRFFLLFLVFTLKIGFSLRIVETNRILRQKKFYDAIASQEAYLSLRARRSRPKFPPKIPFFFKLYSNRTVLSLRAKRNLMLFQNIKLRTRNRVS
jgi:hypothetical protein